MCVHFEGACLEKITSSDVSELLMCGSHFQRLIAYFLFRMRCIHNRFLSTNQMPRQAGEQTNGDEVRGNTGASRKRSCWAYNLRMTEDLRCQAIPGSPRWWMSRAPRVEKSAGRGRPSLSVERIIATALETVDEVGAQ
ncbi:transcriptional repressor TetR, partial [Pseudomonas syringae pv. actinidiae ICMP 18804]